MNEGEIQKNGIKNPWAIISNEPCDSQLAEPIQNFNHENGVWEYHFIIIMSSEYYEITKKSSSCVCAIRTQVIPKFWKTVVRQDSKFIGDEDVDFKAAPSSSMTLIDVP